MLFRLTTTTINHILWLMVLLLVLLGVFSPARAESRLNEQTLDYYISAASAYHQIDPALLRALIWQESRRNHKAISSKGATGYTQLMPGTAKDLGVNFLNPWENIFGGAAYLRKMLNRYNNQIPLALAAYNAGPERVKEAIPNIPETRYYVAVVLFYYDWYRQNT